MTPVHYSTWAQEGWQETNYREWDLGLVVWQGVRISLPVKKMGSWDFLRCRDIKIT